MLVKIIFLFIFITKCTIGMWNSLKAKWCPWSVLTCAHISACDIMEFKIWLLFVSCKSNILWWIIWIEIEIPYISSQHKCAMYWPSKQAKSEAHGPLRVTYLDEEAFAHYTLRRFEVKPVEHSTHYSQVCLKFTFLSRYEINMYD